MKKLVKIAREASQKLPKVRFRKFLYISPELSHSVTRFLKGSLEQFKELIKEEVCHFSASFRMEQLLYKERIKDSD